MDTEFKSSIENPLRKMFPEEWLRETARETGLIKRERKIDPTIMFWVLTLSFGVRLQRTLASLKCQYQKEANTKLSDAAGIIVLLQKLLSFFINVSFTV